LSEAALEPKTSHTKSNPEELREELEMIRQRGYAEDNQEMRRASAASELPSSTFEVIRWGQ